MAIPFACVGQGMDWRAVGQTHGWVPFWDCMLEPVNLVWWFVILVVFAVAHPRMGPLAS